jgi:hypothetical protein
MDCDGLTFGPVLADVQSGLFPQKSELKLWNVTKVPNLTNLIVVLDGNPYMSNSWKTALAITVACTISASTFADSGWRNAGEKPPASNSSKKNKTPRFALPKILARAKALSSRGSAAEALDAGAAFIAGADNNSIKIAPTPPRTGWKKRVAGSKKSLRSCWKRSKKKLARVPGRQSYSGQQLKDKNDKDTAESGRVTYAATSDAPAAVLHSASSASNTEADTPTKIESKQYPTLVFNVSHTTTSSGDDAPAVYSARPIAEAKSDNNGVAADCAATALVEVKAATDSSRSDYLQQLHELAHKDDERNSAGQVQQGSYLSDLNQLIAGDSKWLLAKDELLDLEPGAAEPILMSGDYLSDLQKLVAGMPTVAQQTRFASAAQYAQNAQRPYRLTYSQNETTQRYYKIPRSLTAECREPGQDQNSADISALFTPLHAIDVNAHSTAPPTLPKRVENGELELPEDFSCEWMGANAPSYYYAHGYGVRRAPRNTHQFYNNPLYFEDPNLERCGRSKGCLTTASSALHFAAQIATMPYKATVNHPSDCVAALPDCPTCHKFGSDAYLPEWSWKAAAVQAAAITGAFYAIP